MTFFCFGCGIEKDFSECRFWVWPSKGDMQRYCKACRSQKAAVPDVYWDGKPEINLADDPNTGQPRVFFSKGQKAQYLKERGLMEAGDRVHGASVMVHQNQHRKVDSRSMVQEALRKVKQMGRDYRKREYNRIIKEGRNFA